MARLLDLADEILLQIISYLKPVPPMFTGPFHIWHQQIDRQNANAFFKIKDLKFIVASCKRLHNILTPTLYSYIPLTDDNVYRKRQLPVLLQVLQNNEELQNYITCAHAKAGDTIDFQNFFWMPNMKTLSISDYNAWEAMQWEDQNHVGISEVKVLHLRNCGAHEAPLAEILSWPRALKELWYDAEQGEWSGRYGDQDPVEFTCAAVGRALAPQAASLEKLVFSRKRQDHEGLGYGDVINLRAFEKLTSLSINQVFLVGWGHDRNVWEQLPPSLMELDVFYDDSGYIDFLEGDAERPDWLFGLLEHKETYVPKLERVRITSLEWWPDDYDEEERNEDSGDESEPEWAIQRRARKEWVPPVDLYKSFDRAGVGCSVFIHQKRRFRTSDVDGDRAKGFAEQWEDSWTMEDM